MAEDHDPYWKLRPPPPMSDADLCSCTGAPPILLQAHLTSNPLSCIACILEVPPERLGFSDAFAERLASWQRFHDCSYLLWLDSGEFEAWARVQLEDPASPVNGRALELVSELRALRLAYYWWFQATGEEDFQPLSRCPVCEATLAERYGRHLCEECSIVIAN